MPEPVTLGLPGQMLRKLEKYEVLDEIGHGGMATVYRARDSSLDRFVALKVLHPHLQRTSEARARFTREAKSVAKLRHPHILEIYDYSGEASDETYIAAELLTGPTLKDFVLKQRELPAEIAACIALQLADALGAAHAKGIIHRDVKPENVLIHEDRCVKLTDFGIAYLVDAHTFTVTGQILGSPGHMAPEQVEGGTTDVRSDLFSLGTVLYYCATGRLPFIGRNPHHLLKLLLDGEYPDPLRLRPSIGAELAQIMNKALARVPGNRYQSADEMADRLRAFLTEMGIDDPDETLARYLAEPNEVAEELEQHTVQRLLVLGAEAAKSGQVSKAQAALSRVLALDDGNDRALKLLGALGRRRRVNLVIALVAAVLVLSLAGVGYLSWQRADESPLEAETVPTAEQAHERHARRESRQSNPIHRAAPKTSKPRRMRRAKQTTAPSKRRQTAGVGWSSSRRHRMCRSASMAARSSRTAQIFSGSVSRLAITRFASLVPKGAAKSGSFANGFPPGRATSSSRSSSATSLLGSTSRGQRQRTQPFESHFQAIARSPDGSAKSFRSR